MTLAQNMMARSASCIAMPRRYFYALLFSGVVHFRMNSRAEAQYEGIALRKLMTYSAYRRKEIIRKRMFFVE